ncbi:hypothetical protein VNO77_44423 [Canavalia gladiata]|uniref:Uncharacterized protein n=1 Tax=Canavalia gladiata TaxID=3824 RepID=A0AAN9JVX5_CANGL
MVSTTTLVNQHASYHVLDPSYPFPSPVFSAPIPCKGLVAIARFWATWARGKGWARPICASLQVQAYLGLITKSVSQHSTMQGVSTWEDPMQKERQNQAITGPTSEHV